MSTEGKMGLMDFLKRGLRFRVCGLIGDTLRMEDDKTGEVNRYVRIEGFGRTYNLSVDTDEELSRFKDLSGSPVRASGKLGRRRGAAAATAKIDTLTVPGTRGWTDLTDDEIREGCVFDGIGIVTEKRFSEFRGNTYRSMQLGMMGETFLFQDIAPEMFERIPETGPAKVGGKLNTKIVSGAAGKISDLIFVLEDVKAQTMPGERTNPPQQEEKKTA